MTVANDALERSLSEHERALEQQVRSLRLALGELLASVSEIRDAAAVNGVKIDRCMAATASATARAELAIVKAQESVHAVEILDRVAGAAEGEQPEPEPKRKCRRKLPPGWGGIVAGVALAWGLLKAHHKAAAIAGGAALLTAASAPMAAQYLPDTDAQLVPSVAHHHFHDHRVDPDPVTAVTPPRRHRRGTVTQAQAKKKRPFPKARAAVTPAAPPPPPVPSPAATVPVPAATPTVTPTVPGPSPAPTATVPVPGSTPDIPGAAVRVLKRMLPVAAIRRTRWDN